MHIIVELEGSQLIVKSIEYNFVFKVDMINASNFVYDDFLMQELIFVVMINVMLSMIVSHKIDIQDVQFIYKKL